MSATVAREKSRDGNVDGSAAPWRVRGPYRRLCAAVTVSETGDWLLFIALPLYVLGVSGSALDTSTVFLAELIPAVVIGIVGAPLIDRWDPGRLLVPLTGLQALAVLPLLWAGHGSLWLIYAVAAAQAGFTSLTTPAQQAVVPLLVDPRQILRANAIVAMAGNAARLLGSPLGGVLLPIVGLRGLVIADAISFVVSAALLIRPQSDAPRSPLMRSSASGGPLTAIAEGWHAARASTTLLAALTISFLAAVAQGLFLMLFILFVLRSLHAGDQLVGLLRGVQAVGGVLGGLLIATWGKRLSARTQAICGLAAFAAISALAWNSPLLTTAPGWYVVLFVAVGIPATALGAGLVTGTQQASPSRLRGRVLSLLAVAQALGQAAGILAAGLLSAFTPLLVLLNAQPGAISPAQSSRSAALPARIAVELDGIGIRFARGPMRLGELDIHRVPDMERWAVTLDGVFPTLAPAALQEARNRFGSRFVDLQQDLVLLSVHTWVVRTPRLTILIDTCHGNHKDRRSYPETANRDSPYLELLRGVGVAPEDVDLIMCTHLHPDHIGWNTRLIDGRWVPTFPRARYLMSEVDHATFSALHASDPEGPAADVARSFGDSVLPVIRSGQAVFVGDGHSIETELDAAIRLESAPGHTDGQLVVHLESQGRRALATGDVIHHVLQLNNLDLPAAGDADPVTSARTRRRIVEGVADTDTLLLPGHFVAPSWGRVVSQGDRLEFAFAPGE